MNITITQWHRENTNDWCAIVENYGGRKLIDRDESLKKLSERMKHRQVIYGKAWMLGISKDEPLAHPTSKE